jgi:hypothetical protein
MASTPKRLATGQLPSSSAALFTSTNIRTQIIAATLSNPTAGALTYSFWIVPASSSATDATIVHDAVSLAAGTSVILSELIGHVLNAGDAVHGLASSATSLTYHFSGTELS